MPVASSHVDLQLKVEYRLQLSSVVSREIALQGSNVAQAISLANFA